MESKFDYCLIDNIVLSIIRKHNNVYGMENIEDRIKNLFVGSSMKVPVSNCLICAAKGYNVILEKILANDIPCNIRINSQEPVAYFKTKDLYISITTVVPYLNLYKRYDKQSSICERSRHL
jgi:hypothetical protein